MNKSKVYIAVLTVVAAGAAVAVHFIPKPFEPIGEALLTVFFAHWGITFGDKKKEE